MGFTKAALDLFISEKIGQVTKCGATDVAKEFPGSDTWVSAFGLCVIFQDHPPAPIRQVSLQFVRRVEMAFAEYSHAVENLENLVSGGSKRWTPYFRALYHFEASICQLYHACESTKKGPMLGPLDNLREIYDASKHERAWDAQTVWVTNEGISAYKKRDKKYFSIFFAELEELLRSCARIANRLTNQDLSEPEKA